MAGIAQESQGLNRRRFYPSVRTILLVRFDPGTVDGYSSDEIWDEAEPDPYIASRRNNRFKTLTGASSAVGPKGTHDFQKSFRSLITDSNANLGDAVARIQRADEFTRVLDLQPLKSSRRINTYRKADELELTFDWRDCPFDSRLVRAIYVLHYEGTTTADGFSTGSRSTADSPNPTGYIVPAIGKNLRFVGLVDEISDAHGEGDSLTMKASDLTRLLIDTKFSPKQEIKFRGSSIVDAVEAILATNPVFKLIRSTFLRVEDKTLLEFKPGQVPRLGVSAKELHRQDKRGGGPTFSLRKPPKGGGDSSYWDVLTDICASHGLRPSIEQDKFVLVEPRQLYKGTPEELTQPGVPTFPTKYRLDINDRFPVRRMVFGSNIAAVRFSRKLTRMKAPNVQVTSRNPNAMRAVDREIVARWPPKFERDQKKKKATATAVDASGSNPQITVHPVQLSGITDKALLQKIAKQIYEGMGRQELCVVIETDDVASFSNNENFDPNLDPDLLAVRAGDPIQILVAPAVDQSSRLFTLSELQVLVDRAKKSATAPGTRPQYTAAVKYLEDQGWSRENAKQFVRVLSSASLPREFRLIEATITFDGSSDSGGGFNVQMDCRNYVVARADPQGISQTRKIGSQAQGTAIEFTESEGSTIVSGGVVSFGDSEGTVIGG